MKDNPTLIPSQGMWVQGEERFWGRETELEMFEEGIDEGANYLLVAQRRMGKTSLMREVARRLDERYACVFVDFEKSSSAADAIVELSVALREHKGIWTKTKELFGNILGKVGAAVDTVKLSELSITLRSGLTQGNWAQKGDELFEILAASDRPVLLLLDEVPILVNRLLKGGDSVITDKRRADTEAFMSWLRHNSQKHKGNVRIVLSGSIGLEPVLRQARLTATLNTFTAFELRPWDERTAVGCLEALARGKGVSYADGVPEQMIQQIGCSIPHHVQMFFGHAYSFLRRRKTTSLLEIHVKEVYEQGMLSVRGHAELTHYEDRLRLVLGDDALKLAMEMLTEAAVTGSLGPAAYRTFEHEAKIYLAEGTDIRTAQQEILRVLEHDGYLELEGEVYRFVSALVRDWWKSRHSFAYVSVLEREG